MYRMYRVEYTMHEHGDIKSTVVHADNKAEAYDMAVYEDIFKKEGELPYSAWVESVQYANGHFKVFNTHEGKPY